MQLSQLLHSCDDSIEMMRDEYNRRRRYVVKALNDMGLTCFEPRGAFYVFPCIRCSGLTSQEFLRNAVERAGGCHYPR